MVWWFLNKYVPSFELECIKLSYHIISYHIISYDVHFWKTGWHVKQPPNSLRQNSTRSPEQHGGCDPGRLHLRLCHFGYRPVGPLSDGPAGRDAPGAARCRAVHGGVVWNWAFDLSWQKQQKLWHSRKHTEFGHIDMVCNLSETFSRQYSDGCIWLWYV